MKHAVVTGASRGIGKAITDKLLKENIRVTGTRRSSEFPPEFQMSELFTEIQVDLNDFDAIYEKLNPVFQSNSELPDVLINNAGIFIDADFEVSDEDWLEVWDQTMNVNLRSAALLSKWFINAHQKSGSEGIIINIASRAAYRGDTQEYAAYAASKGGMAAFTKSIARDFSKKGIVAYTVAPGFIETDMAKESVDILGVEALTAGSAFDEITQPEEVANLVSFLASGEVKHMTGSTFHINGGSYMV
ncbi:SDR family NAD(P)-dependent oxidoreductase [Rhodohalobacter barkolensis]|uniref:SDR family oxidoreductase n=1 Tax=Rhodohalobacter barkolensis TaxID=2053187 RepID=A0A2N0VL55_9BACT|nr:SDR family NAD(P)-dependent oxidoreductase [Rhodohalobacter barkolensis]PKD44871.1 SDR family oxidoreductase [Rhodohalobacter barkolensis]